MQVTATMKAWRLCCITMAALGVHLGAVALDVDDCVLNGLKGVNSDAAARMVRQACENKFESKKRLEIYENYGEPVDRSIRVIKSVSAHDPAEASFYKRVTVLVENDLPLTAVLIRVSLWTEFLGGTCDPPEQAERYVYLFKVKVKPGSQAKLVADRFFNLGDLPICASATVLRGREQKLTDVTFGSYTVLTADEARLMGKALGNTFYPSAVWGRRQ